MSDTSSVTMFDDDSFQSCHGLPVINVDSFRGLPLVDLIFEGPHLHSSPPIKDFHEEPLLHPSPLVDHFSVSYENLQPDQSVFASNLCQKFNNLMNEFFPEGLSPSSAIISRLDDAIGMISCELGVSLFSI